MLLMNTYCIHVCTEQTIFVQNFVNTCVHDIRDDGIAVVDGCMSAESVAQCVSLF